MTDQTDSTENAATPGAQSGDRQFDIILFGATGFTGGLCAEYLAAHLPEGATWALAGRSADKLEDVVERLDTGSSRAATPETLVADIADPESLTAMASAGRVLITTVGPYLQYGEPVVAACVEAGTDYVDLTGEPEFVDSMYLRHHDRAVETGARLVHACGFDSIPHDLGVLYTTKHLPEGVPVGIYGAVRADAQFSGGTFHSAIHQISRLDKAKNTAKERRKKEGRPAGGRKVRSAMQKPHKDDILDRWLAPLPTIDPQVVLRSAAALDSYGPDFSYGHYASTGSRKTIAMAMAGLGAVAVGSRIGPVRKQMLKRIDAGRGPSEERRKRSSFDVTFVARAGGRVVVTRVSGGDPGYTETSMMLSESAMCLAFDDLPDLAGQLTTAQAMGDRLLERVESGGLTFEVLRD